MQDRLCNLSSLKIYEKVICYICENLFLYFFGFFLYLCVTFYRSTDGLILFIVMMHFLLDVLDSILSFGLKPLYKLYQVKCMIIYFKYKENSDCFKPMMTAIPASKINNCYISRIYKTLCIVSTKDIIYCMKSSHLCHKLLCLPISNFFYYNLENFQQRNSYYISYNIHSLYFHMRAELQIWHLYIHVMQHL